MATAHDPRRLSIESIQLDEYHTYHRNSSLVEQPDVNTYYGVSQSHSPVSHPDAFTARDQTTVYHDRDHIAKRPNTVHHSVSYKSTAPFIGDSKDVVVENKSSGRFSLPSMKGRGPNRRGNFWWNPTWLGTWTLCVFVLVLVVLMITTVALFVDGKDHDGLVKQEEKWRYAWVYGPTAFLVLVLAMWRQVDHCCKLLAPWSEMRKGPADVKDSLLLDYTSPIFVIALYDALRNRHWSIVLSSLGFLFLKLSIMFSTGLFILEPTTILLHDVPMFATSRLDATDFALRNVTSQAALTYYGILAQNISYPLGTLPNTVVETFRPVDTRYDQAPITGNVYGITTEMECEIAKTTEVKNSNLPWRSITQPFFLTNISTSDCNIDRYIIGYGAGHSGFAKNVSQNYQGVWDYATCNDGADNSLFRPDQLGSSVYRESKPGFNDTRLIISVLNLTWVAPPDVWENPTQLSSPGTVNYTVQGSTALVCKPGFRLSNFTATFPPTHNDQMTAVEIPGTQTDVGQGFTNSSLSPQLYSTFNNIGLGFDSPDFVISPVDPMFVTMVLLNGNSSIGAFMNPDLLEKGAQELLTNVGTQLAHGYISRPAISAETFAGDVLSTEDRLQVNEVSTGLMAACFGIVSLLAVGLIFVRPRNVVPMRPDSIGAMTAILASSSALRARMSGLSRSSLTTIAETLSNDKYVTVADGNSFKIQPVKAHLDPYLHKAPEMPKKQLEPNRWYDPMTWGTTSVVMLIGLPLILIAVLEALQQTSDKNDGLVDLPSLGNNRRLIYTYLPSLVMFGVATQFTSLDFSLSVIAPFTALQRGDSSVKTVMETFVDKFPPHAFVLAVRDKHIPHAISIFAAFLSSFLVIIVSGLYSTQTIPATTQVSLAQSDAFNYAMSLNLAGDKNAGVSTSVIELSNGTYVGYDYGEMAFPSIRLDDNQKTNGTVSVLLPGVRSSLQCTTATEYEIQTYGNAVVGWTQDYRYPGSIPYSITTNLSTSCLGQDAQSPTVPYTQYFFVSNDTSQNYSGKATSLTWFTGPVTDYETNTTSLVNIVQGEAHTWNLTEDVVQNGCPSFSITLASLSNTPSVPANLSSGGDTNYTVTGNVTLGICTQHLEEVTSNVTLLLPSLTLDPTNPPITLEDTARPIPAPNDPSSNIYPYATNSLIPALRSGFFSSLGYIDGFLEALVTGKDGIPLSSLAGRGNEATLYSAANTLHRTYMAQAFNFKGRTTTPSTSAEENPHNSLSATYPAVLVDASRQRLVQHRSPTTALEVLLGVVALLAAAAMGLGRVRRVLPHNPMSVAGLATLLAESMVSSREVVPLGAELDIRDAGRALQGWSLGLGWGGDGSRSGKGWFGVGVKDSTDGRNVL